MGEGTKPALERPEAGGWTVLGLGVGLLVASTILLFLGLGPRGGVIAPVVFIYIFAFLGGGSLAALALFRWMVRREERDDEA